jgi:hypothetical protein
MMAYKDGSKSGGRAPGSKNKLTLAKARIRAEAMAKIGEEHPDAFKGQPLDFLLEIMRSPDFDPDMRMEAATRAAQYVHAKKSESTIDDKRNYIVQMPAPISGATRQEQAAEWRRQYGGADTAAEDDAWAEKLAIAQAQAAESKRN